jgi:hypothetical protein
MIRFLIVFTGVVIERRLPTARLKSRPFEHP